ncbi:MAG: VCBS repeat-containing protein [Myxococcales bacterium]|nr:VCBS repeat-containing protein [Myxococcales bacterium]
MSSVRTTSARLRAFAFALLAIGPSTGCSVLDLPDPPTFELNDNDRVCRVDTDCAGVEIVSERGDLIESSDPDGEAGPLPACLGVSVVCNINHGVCEAEVRVRDGDGDGAFDPACQGFPFAPLVEDCDDSNPDVIQRDADGDGQVSVSCTRDPGPDCDDTRDSVRSGAPTEICDGFLSDCDAWVMGVSPARPEEDRDGDQVAAPDAPCEAPPTGDRALTSGFPKTDCDDTNPFVFPGAPEVCDGAINDCGLGSGPRAGEDDDGDGFGAPTATCVDSEAFPKTDCDDMNAATYPGAPEICDRLTNDCNMPQVPRLEEDFDGDGLASYDAPCAPGPIPYGECIDGADMERDTRFCSFLERSPGLDALTDAAAIAFYDYDGDGLGDIVAGSSSNNPVRLYLQQGGGQFASGPSIVPGGALRALRVGRLFDDAYEDLVLVRQSGAIEVVCHPRQMADPSVSRELVTGFTGARDAAVVRLTDSIRAVVAISPLSGNLQIAARTEVPTRCADLSAFDTTTIPLGSGMPSAVAAGRLLTRATDVEDVVVATTEGNVLILRNNPVANGGLTLEGIPIATGLDDALSAGVADFDGDGLLDVVIGSATGAHYLRNTTGMRDGFVVSDIPNSPPGVVSVYAADINLDGRADLVTASAIRDSVDWWELRDGTWVKHPLVSDFNDANAAVAGDVDGDGDLDVIGVARGADLVTWWTTEVTSNAGFTRSKVDRAFDGASATVAAEINGDGRPDIVGLGSTMLSWWSVQGSVSAPVYMESSIANLNGGRALAAGDLNADGLTDVVVADLDGVRVMLNRGTGAQWAILAGTNGLGSGTGVLDLALGDVTGDGLVDVVGVTATSVRFWANSGGSTPTFTMTDVGAQTSATGVALGDTNGDGLLDIVVSNTQAPGTAGLQVFARPSAGAAFTATLIADAPRASDVAVGDIDGDGRAEIFAGAFNLASLVAYWSWSGTAYVRHVLSTGPSSVWTHRLTLADMDSDGDQDLVASFATPVAVRWFENVNGTDAGWVLHLLTTQGAIADGLAAADYDADGDVDLSVAHGGDSEVVLYKNDGVAWWRPGGR